MARTPARPGPAAPAPARRRALRAVLVTVTVLSLAGCVQQAQPASSPSARASSSVPAPGTHSPPPVSTTTAPSAASSPAPPPSAASPSSASNSGAPAPQPSSSPANPSGPIADLFGKEWTQLPTSDRVVALTFDAGGNADGLTSILATLSAKRVPATFFLTGDWTKAFPSQASQIGPEHRLGNHSVSHPRFTELTDERIRSEVLDAGRGIEQATGADPAPWFRFPFGDRDPRTIGLVNRAGYVPIGWTVDTLGWKGSSGGITSDRVLQRVLDALTPGEIVLMHVGSHPADGSTLDADALPGIVDALRARGYSFVTLDAMRR